jgi:hypothetical protein
MTSSLPVLLLALSVSAVAAPDPDVDKILDICRSNTTTAAAARGDALGWPRMTDAQTAAWRRSAVAYNGGTVDLVAWQQPPEAGSAALSFWVSRGPNRHLACSYTPSDPAALLDALTRHLGPPDTLDRTGEGTSATWQRDGREYAYSRFASAGGLVVSNMPD